MMTDTKLLMYQLRNAPVMSMALNKYHLYKMMAESMSAAADVIEELLNENAQLRKANTDMGWELNPDRMGGQFTEEEINRGSEWR
jgi:hypothetical protein